MRFTETELKGAYIIESEPFTDFRGIFSRTFCEREFKEHGLEYDMKQTNLSINFHKYTFRGMHYEVEGGEQARLVRCIKGKILDIILDLRNGSTTFGRHLGVELTDTNNKMVYVPKGFAHGFLTLEQDCHAIYQVSNFYNPGKERGVRWNDPYFNIKLPTDKLVISKKDSAWPDYEK